MRTRMAGITLLTVGIALLIYNANFFAFLTWSFIFLIISTMMIFIGFNNKNQSLVLTGGIVASISLYGWGLMHIQGWPEHWSLLLVFFGISIILLYISNKKPLTGLSGLILLLCGICANPVIKKIEALTPISNAIHIYWPVLFIFLGLIFLFRR